MKFKLSSVDPGGPGGDVKIYKPQDCGPRHRDLENAAESTLFLSIEDREGAWGDFTKLRNGPRELQYLNAYDSITTRVHKMAIRWRKFQR